MIFPIIVELEEKGYLKSLTKAGLISTKVHFHYEICIEYDKRIRVKTRNGKVKLSEKGHRHIVVDLSNLFDVTEQTIYKVIKTFKVKYENRSTDSNEG